MSDPSLFTSKAEQLIHELKEVKTVQEAVKGKFMMQDRKIKELEHQIDQYIVKLFEEKDDKV